MFDLIIGLPCWDKGRCESAPTNKTGNKPDQQNRQIFGYEQRCADRPSVCGLVQSPRGLLISENLAADGVNVRHRELALEWEFIQEHSRESLAWAYASVCQFHRFCSVERPSTAPLNTFLCGRLRSGSHREA
jgi:hypothetical protein